MRIPLAVAVVGALFALPAPAADFTGIWNLSVSESNTTKRAETLIVGPLGSNTDQTISKVVDQSGEMRQSKTIRIYDGKARPSQGSGFEAARSEICQIVDSNTRRVMVSENGKEVAVLTSTISPDGQTMTNVWTGRSPETLVYRRYEPLFLQRL
jgi:hypothetical protein